MDRKIQDILINKIYEFSGMNCDFESSQSHISKGVLSRIYSIIDLSEDFYFERDYVETEWKDMVSLHYVNTVYKCDNRVARVHFFSKKCCLHNSDEKGAHLDDELVSTVEDDCYLGFITLRPIPEPEIMLSFVYPNYDTYKFFNGSHILYFKKKVHLCGRELIIHTFPHFSQDGIAAVCANADLIMISKYLHSKYNYNRLRLTDLSVSNSLFPNDGLSEKEILNLAVKNKIPLRILNVREDTKELIKTYVLSGLPVLIYSDEHIVTIVGVMEEDSDIRFIVYDDSGAFFNYKSYSVGENGSRKISFSIAEKPEDKLHFANAISWDKIQYWLSSEHNGVIVPLFERVILSYDEVKEIYAEMLFILQNRLISNNEEYGEFSNLLERELRIYNASEFKNFIGSQIDLIDDDSIELMKDFLESYSEHFVWVCYGRWKNDVVMMLINPTIYSNSLSYFPSILFVKEELLEQLDKYNPI